MNESRMTKATLLAIVLMFVTFPIRQQIVQIDHFLAGVAFMCIAYGIILWFERKEKKDG